MLVLPRAIYDTLLEEAIGAPAVEVCGLLAGEFDPDQSRVATIHSTENVAADPAVEYAIEPEAQYELLERIEDEGREVVGFYHSHPHGPPRPSATDVARANWPDRSYLIVDLGGEPFVGSWRWRAEAEAFAPEAIVLDT